ncbi:hypothetical protein ABER02_09415 [Rossellomorea marisflavi]|uniref:hypothetical protein n=1 Tax=Rossellomorea marisflavi TaxID=189381 RepID=UPI00207A13BC|nr:hypothetical protein [Rossellomorea marisflavi]USK91802.1 hypothetical protein LIT29_20355 [Rossellomorea marisflavi]
MPKIKYSVVDLDETFISKNTFKLWLIFLMKSLLRSGSVKYSIKLFVILIKRLFKKISHMDMKRETLKITNENVVNLNVDKFVFGLDKYVNKNILDKMLNDQNTYWILATAAPEIYSKKIAFTYGFNHCISTSMVIDEQWNENIREIKLKNVLNYLKSKDTNCISAVFTDHHDDLPLMRISEKVYLVNPKEASKLKVDEQIKNYTTILVE